MKRFIIGISAIILLLFIGFIAVFYGGFYVDSGRDNHVNTFVRTENKEILIKDKVSGNHLKSGELTWEAVFLVNGLQIMRSPKKPICTGFS